MLSIKNFFLLLIGILIFVQQHAQYFKGRVSDRDYYQLKKDTIYSKYHTKEDNRKIVDVYLPFNFDTYSNVKFQVVYLLNSNLLNNNFPELYIYSIVHKTYNGLLPPTIFVSVNNNNVDIYNDSTDAYLGKSAVLFNDYFTQELIPYIHQRYHTASFKTLVVNTDYTASKYAIYLMKHTKLFNAFVLFTPANTIVAKDNYVPYEAYPNFKLPYSYIPLGDFFKTKYIRQCLSEDSNYQFTLYLVSGTGDNFGSKHYAQSIYDSLQSIHSNRVNAFLDIENENPEHDANMAPYAFAKAMDYIYKDYVKIVWQSQLWDPSDFGFEYGKTIDSSATTLLWFNSVKQCWKKYDMDMDISVYILAAATLEPIVLYQDTIQEKKVLDYYQENAPRTIAYLCVLAHYYKTIIGDNKEAIQLYKRAIAQIPQSTDEDYHIYTSVLANNIIDVKVINYLYIPLIDLYGLDSNYENAYRNIESIYPAHPIDYYYLANISFTHHYKVKASIAYLKKWIDYLMHDNTMKQVFQYQFDTSEVSDWDNYISIPLMFKNPNLSHSYILLSKLYASIGKEDEARKYALLGERVE